MSTYTEPSTTNPPMRFRDRAKAAKAKIKAYASAISGRLPSVTLSGIRSNMDLDRQNRLSDSLVTAGLIALFTLNGFILYPLIYGGFLAVIYPSWTAPSPPPKLPRVIDIRTANILEVMIDKLNEVTIKFAQYCFTKDKQLRPACQYLELSTSL